MSSKLQSHVWDSPAFARLIAYQDAMNGHGPEENPYPYGSEASKAYHLEMQRISERKFNPYKHPEKPQQSEESPVNLDALG